MGAEERELLLAAFDSNWIAPLGPDVDAFEREVAERVGCAHAVALSSGTAGLHLALINLGVGAGDTVLCSSLTFAASANAIRYCGAEPVFVDSTSDTWNLDPALLVEELERSSRTGRLPRAAIVVDLYGQCADYAAIEAACARFDIPIIEDAAEALGATYGARSAGTFGEMGVLSFNGNKIITTSGGGMLLSHRKEHADRARHLATQARDPAPHYEHSHVGYNYRLSNLLAALGRGQLRALDQRIDRKKKINTFYRGAFEKRAGISFLENAAYGQSNQWLTCIQVDPEVFGATREEIRVALEQHDIESRPVWKPMHLQPIYRACRFVGSGVSNRLFERGLCLPSGASLTSDDLHRIVALVSDVGRAAS